MLMALLRLINIRHTKKTKIDGLSFMNEITIGEVTFIMSYKIRKTLIDTSNVGIIIKLKAVQPLPTMLA